MNRTWNIVGRVAVWVVLVAILVAAGLLHHKNEQGRRVEQFRVVVTDSTELNMITAAELAEMVCDEGLNPVGSHIDSIKLLAINNLAKEQSLVAKARTFVNYDNVVTLEVEQREPVVRFVLEGGYDFYATADLHILPVRNQGAIDLPIVTGNFTPPFERGFEGNLKALMRANKKNSDKNYLFIRKLINFVRYTEKSPDTKGKIVQTVLSQRGKGDHRTTVVELIPRQGNYIVSLGELENIKDKLDRWQRFVEAQVVKTLDGGTLVLEYDGQAVWRPAPKPEANTSRRR